MFSHVQFYQNFIFENLSTISFGPYPVVLLMPSLVNLCQWLVMNYNSNDKSKQSEKNNFFYENITQLRIFVCKLFVIINLNINRMINAV